MARIMIIDDDVELADNTAELMRKHGHEVSVMHAIEGAAARVAEIKADVLILDVMFPDNQAGGFDLARRIRRDKAGKNLPIILLTGINQEFPMDFSVNDIDSNWMPVQDFMEKPVRISALLEKVNRLLKTA